MRRSGRIWQTSISCHSRAVELAQAFGDDSLSSRNSKPDFT